MSRQAALASNIPPTISHIYLNLSTWTKDSHGLYDYEAMEDSYKRETKYIKNSCKVYRNNARNEIIIKESKDNSLAIHNDSIITLVTEVVVDRSKSTPEFKLKYNPMKYMDNNDGLAFYRTPYLVIKDFQKVGRAPGYPLKPGNIIKLGRVEYMVIEAKNYEETFTLRDTNHFEETNGVFEIKNSTVTNSVEEGSENIPLDRRPTQITSEEANCKICLCNDVTQFDPLIAPCNCKGSCELIHVNCLKKWINSKVKKEIKGIATSYNFTKFECEICKFPFPQIIRFDEKDIEMMTISKPNRPYILLESLCQKTENKEERCLHLISTAESSAIKIGRGHECEIRISDISVSRKHAEIILRDGQFYILDTNAKFGTLIKIEEDYLLTQSRGLKIQCGRTIYEFKVKGEPYEVETE